MLSKITKEWKKTPSIPRRVIAFGSSNTELHWHSLGHFNWFSWLNSAFQEWVGRHMTFINQGICGETVVDLVKRLDRDVLSYNPDLVIITIGGNDANRNMPVAKYKQNLKNIITRLQEKQIIPVLQTYYYPIYENMGKSFQRFPEYVQVNRDLASKFNIPLIDQYKHFRGFCKQDRLNYAKIMLDALHVNEIGNVLMGVIVSRYFGLPDPIFYLNNDLNSHYLGILEKHGGLPPKNKSK